MLRTISTAIFCNVLCYNDYKNVYIVQVPGACVFYLRSSEYNTCGVPDTYLFLGVWGFRFGAENHGPVNLNRKNNVRSHWQINARSSPLTLSA